MGRKKRNRINRIISRTKTSDLDRYTTEVPGRWWDQQEILRRALDIPQSFKTKGGLVRVMNELNKKNFKSEAAFDLKLREFLTQYKYPDLPFKYKRNWPILNKYFGDFVFHRRRVIVELDGGVHSSEQQKEYDARRDRQLAAAGWKVYRIQYPSMAGIETAFDSLRSHKETIEKNSLSQKQATIKKKEVITKSNAMLIGCKNDGSVLKAMRKEAERIAKSDERYKNKMRRVEMWNNLKIIKV